MLYLVPILLQLSFANTLKYLRIICGGGGDGGGGSGDSGDWCGGSSGNGGGGLRCPADSLQSNGLDVYQNFIQVVEEFHELEALPVNLKLDLEVRVLHACSCVIKLSGISHGV